MPTIDVYNTDREKVSQVELSDAVFGTDVKEHLLYAVVRYQLAKKRAGTHAVKRRSDVSGGGKKPFRQKGTGRARAGTTRAAQWRGGGVVFGPTPRSYAFKINKKVRLSALKSALSQRVAGGDVVVLDDLKLPEIKTRQVTDFMSRFELADMCLLVSETDDNVLKSARNLQNVTILHTDGLNVYDILHRANLVMTQGAVDAITQRLGGE